MPTYFFHLYNDEVARDREGEELPNDAAALQRGAIEARNMAAESVRKGHLILDHRIVVCAEDERQVGVVHSVTLLRSKADDAVTRFDSAAA